MKKFFAALLAAAMVLTVSGCGEKEENNTQTVETEDVDLSDNEEKDSEDVQDEEDDKVDAEPATAEASKPDSDADSKTETEVTYDKDDSHSGKIGEKLSNEFFTMQVNSAHRMTSVNGYTSNDEAFEFLCVNVTVQNNTTETINVGTYDFDIRWGDNDDSWDYAIEQEGFGFDNYPYGLDLERFRSVEGNVFFMVPVDADKLYFEYLVAYDDNTTGDVYYVELSDLGYMDDPEPAVENPVYYSEIGAVQSTDYFDMTVNNAFVTYEIGDLVLDSQGEIILGVDVTLTNTSAQPIETGAYFFCTYWGEGGEGEFVYAIEDEDFVDFPIYTELAAGESLSGIMYFFVPVDTAVTFEYSDFYSETEWVDYRTELGVPARQ